MGGCDRISDLEDAIDGLPPSVTGLCLKIYLNHLYAHLPLSSAKGWVLGPPAEFVTDIEIGLICDAAALLPELAPFCTAVTGAAGE